MQVAEPFQPELVQAIVEFPEKTYPLLQVNIADSPNIVPVGAVNSPSLMVRIPQSARNIAFLKQARVTNMMRM